MPYNYPYDETDRTGNFTGTRATALPVPRHGQDAGQGASG